MGTRGLPQWRCFSCRYTAYWTAYTDGRGGRGTGGTAEFQIHMANLEPRLLFRSVRVLSIDEEIDVYLESSLFGLANYVAHNSL